MRRSLLATFFLVSASLVSAGSIAAVTARPTGKNAAKTHNAALPNMQPQPAGRDALTSAAIKVPVAWQMTRARFLSSGASTQTESFRETWILEARDEGSAYLSSPRARVLVYAAGELSKVGKLPESLILSEKDFAHLLGVAPSTDTSDDTASLGGSPKLINLATASSQLGGEVVTLKVSEDELYTVHLEIGANAY